MTTESAPTKLKTGASLVDVVSIGVGSAVGVAIFSILSPAAQVAGPGMLVSVLIAVVPMVVFALNYAFMGSTVPASGASYVWPSRFVYPYFGFIVAWLRIVGSVGAMTVLALVLVQYLSSVVAVPVKLGMFVLFALVYVVNVLGIKPAAKLQTVMVVVLLLTLGIYVVAGMRKVDLANLQPLAPHGWTAVFSAVALLVSLYLGIESATDIGEEIKDVRRVMPRGIATAVIISIVVYGLVAFVALGTFTAPGLAKSTSPLLDSAQGFLGSAATPIMLAAAVVAIGTSLNGAFLVFTRFLFAMARAGVLPKPLASVSTRLGTPYVATTVAFGLCLVGLALPSTLVFLFLAVNIPTMLKYMGCSLAASRLPKYWPELYAQANFKFSRRWTVALGYLGALLALGIIAAGVAADWRPYALLAGWGVVGTIYWLVTTRHRVSVQASRTPAGQR